MGSNNPSAYLCIYYIHNHRYFCLWFVSLMSPTFLKFFIMQQNDQKMAFLYWDAPAMVTLCFNPFISSLILCEWFMNTSVICWYVRVDTTVILPPWSMGNLSKWIHQFEWSIIPGVLLINHSQFIVYVRIIENGTIQITYKRIQT